MFFGGPTNIQNIPENGQPRIRQNSLPQDSDHFSRDPSAGNYSAPSRWKYPEYYSKHPPKTAIQELRKMAFQGFQPCFIFYPAKSNPQHNAHNLLLLKKQIPKHKGKVAEMAQADAEEVMM